MRILDVAGGTGDIAKRICDTIDQRGGFEDDAGVTVCDVNEEMLAVGEKRLRGRAECILGDAQELPFDSNSFDAYTISFGMRNVPRPDIAMKEAMRVLKPGGRFMMLEFAKVENVLMKQIYDMYSFQVIPRVGSLVAGDEQAYRYLVESIRKFPGQDEVARMLQDIDFRYVSVTDYSGGIAACYSAFKPVS